MVLPPIAQDGVEGRISAVNVFFSLLGTDWKYSQAALVQYTAAQDSVTYGTKAARRGGTAAYGQREEQDLTFVTVKCLGRHESNQRWGECQSVRSFSCTATT
jgi:hypothetical protein